MDCYTCCSLSGERRISPGPTIFEGRYWLIEHAYPTRPKNLLHRTLVLLIGTEILRSLTLAHAVSRL